MDERVRFIVEKSGFFESNFLVKEGLIHRDRFTAMFGMVGLAEAVNMVMEQKEEQMRITKDIYPGLSKKFKSTPSNIEHDLRTVINVCWKTNKNGMDEIAGYPLKYKPTNSEFIDMIAYYLTEEDTIKTNVG